MQKLWTGILISSLLVVGAGVAIRALFREQERYEATMTWDW